MNYYELTYLLAPELDEKRAEELAKNIEEVIGGADKIKKPAAAKRLKLAYPIKKRKEAFLASVEFQTEPQELVSLKNSLEKTPEILRFLLLKKEEVAKKEEIAKKEEAKKEKILEVEFKRPIKEEKILPKPKVALEDLEKELEQIL